MILKEFYELVDGLTIDYEIRMSCYTEDYIKTHLKDSIDIFLSYEENSIIISIDWNSKYKTTLMDFGEDFSNKDENTEIISIDEDDGNIIHFSNIIIDKENKYVILV